MDDDLVIAGVLATGVGAMIGGGVGYFSGPWVALIAFGFTLMASFVGLLWYAVTYG